MFNITPFFFFSFISMPSLPLLFLCFYLFLQCDTDCTKHTKFNNHNNRINNNKKWLTFIKYLLGVWQTFKLLAFINSFNSYHNPLKGYNSYPHCTDKEPDITYLLALSDSNKLMDTLANCKT